MLVKYFLSLQVLFIFAITAQGFEATYSKTANSWKSFILLGDAGVKNNTTQLLKQSLAVNNFKEIISLGDNLYKPFQSYEYVWNDWKQEGFQFPLVAIGNHHSSYDAEVSYFKLPGEYYAKEFNGALFVVLNSDYKLNADIQVRWLDHVLSNAKQKMIFLIYHHPSVTLNSYHAWEDRLRFQTGVRSLIKKHAPKITALLNGHEHSTAIYLLDNVPMVLSGASFEQFKPVLPISADPLFQVSLGWGAKEGFWWSKLDFNSETNEVWIHYLRFDRQPFETCTIRISPKPISRGRNCQ